MKEIDYQMLKNFLDSGMSEEEYFGCDMEGLITLKEYLEEVKIIKDQYNESIKEPLECIMSKNNWVKSVGSNDFGELCIYGNRCPWVSVKRNNDTGIYELDGELVVGLGIKNYFRKRVVENSRDELIEIGKMADKFFDGYYFTTSVSDYFIVKNNYFFSFLGCNSFPLYKINRDSIYPVGDSWQFDELMTTYNKNKLLSKVKIKRSEKDVKI